MWVYVGVCVCVYLFLCMFADICLLYLVSNTLEGPPSPKGVVEPAATGDTLRRPVDHHITPAAQASVHLGCPNGEIWE